MSDGKPYTIKFKLPWKRKGHDGKYYWAILEICYYHSQNEKYK